MKTVSITDEIDVHIIAHGKDHDHATICLSALDHHFADFITRLDSAPCVELWLAAALASAATGQGNVCLDLAATAGMEVIPFHVRPEPLRAPASECWQAVLTGCETVGQPGEYTPLVLDGAQRLYLHRSWEYERSVAYEILGRLVPLDVDAHDLAVSLNRFFPPVAGTMNWQRAAAIAAVSRRLAVISGGPGTGKTSTVARILALLIEQAGDRELRIQLAAPTGKAAMRLRQSILQATLQLELSDAIRSRIPDSVKTIHRLLGVLSGATSFRHNRDNQLQCDVLVVDEASMVDLPLMARLLEALPFDARVILLGDRDQLASVEAGAVLADICNHGVQHPFSTPFLTLVEQNCGPLPPEMAKNPPEAPLMPLADVVIHLRTSYRFGDDSGIGTLSRLINAGAAADALELLQSGTHDDLKWRQLPPAENFNAAFTQAVRDGYAAYGRSANPEEALNELEHFRVLSPLRKGICGVENLNRLSESALGLRRHEGLHFCSLSPVMVTGNSYELGLFNGDTAVLMTIPPDNRLMAFFSDHEGGLRRLSPLRLPPFEPAFAMTVHKSQGSEFDRVLLILPEQISDTLSREVLYTAVTRARSHVEIWGTEEVFRRAVERRVVRSSGLRDRLWGNPQVP